MLHLDESTPHLHATVVPIVTGERRKIKEGKVEPGKKQYRKKSPDTARLCADDVMTRAKLKGYQDSYAESMSKYGLLRGIDGSESRHITPQEYYRNAIAQRGNLQEDIEQLLKMEAAKRETVERLNSQEREAEAELKKVKSQIKTEKLKGSAAEVGTTILDGIGSALGTSKVKRQQQEIDGLKEENRELYEKNAELSRTIIQEREQHTKSNTVLKDELDQIYHWLPDTKPLVKMGQYCKSVGFSEDMTRQLLDLRPVYFSGELYSAEHSQRFRTQQSEARIVRDPQNPGIFRLMIDKIDITQWFRQKHIEFLERIGIKIPERKHGRKI